MEMDSFCIYIGCIFWVKHSSSYVLRSQVWLCKKLNIVQIALSYSQPGTKGGSDLVDFKLKCSTETRRRRVSAIHTVPIKGLDTPIWI